MDSADETIRERTLALKQVFQMRRHIQDHPTKIEDVLATQLSDFIANCFFFFLISCKFEFVLLSIFFLVFPGSLCGLY